MLFNLVVLVMYMYIGYFFNLLYFLFIYNFMFFFFSVLFIVIEYLLIVLSEYFF